MQCINIAFVEKFISDCNNFVVEHIAVNCKLTKLLHQLGSLYIKICLRY